MTKQELINVVTDNSDENRAIVENVINHTLEVIKGTLIRGENIYVREFGTIGTKERQAKIGQDINKGTSITIPAHRVIYFKPGRDFKNEVAKR